jgi:hypothetical protein
MFSCFFASANLAYNWLRKAIKSEVLLPPCLVEEAVSLGLPPFLNNGVWKARLVMSLERNLRGDSYSGDIVCLGMSVAVVGTENL